MIDEQGTIESINPAGLRMFGYDESEVVGQNVKMLMPSPYREEHEGHLQRYCETGVKKIIGTGREIVGRRKDNSTFPGEVAVAETRNGDQRLFTGILRDITERKQAEAELQEAHSQLITQQRMAALGIIGAAVAHELNNPLTGIVNQVEYVLAKLPEDDRHHQVLSKALVHTQRCMRIVEDLLTYSHRGRARQETHEAGDLNRVVQEALDVAEFDLDQAGVKAEVDLAANLPAVALGVDHLRQICLNLVYNACDAMSSQDRKQLVVKTQLVGTEVMLTVQDNGRGMDQETQARLFEPFFTTKPPGSGTGLGLSLCQNLIQSVGGRIDIQSNTGAGSTFTVVLPQIEKGAT